MKLNPFVSDKILYHPERIAEFIKGGPIRPVTWELDLTNRCNQNCPQCAGGRVNQGRSNHDSLSKEEAEDYIVQLTSDGAKAVTFTGGGESLLVPSACHLIQFARRCNVDVGLITNGSLLDQIDLFTLINNCKWIRISLDAGNSQIYKQTHGCGEKIFDRVVHGIELLVKEKQICNAPCLIGTAFLSNERTKNNMLEFTRLSKNLNVDYIQFRPYHLDKTNINKELAQCQTLEDETFKVLSSINKYRHFNQKMPYKVCYGHHFAGVINVHEVYLCCHFRGMPKYKLGDLREKSLSDIWNSDHHKMVYENIDYSDCVPVCRCDPFNRWLWKLKNEVPTHVNFL